MMRASIRLAVCVVSGGALLWLATIAGTGVMAFPRPAELGVIFGTAVQDDGAPKPALRERLETGLALWQRGIVKRLMVSGAMETRNRQDEARIMAIWLSRHGMSRHCM